MIRNQSTIDQIPHPPHVKSLPTPRPTCPKIKRSIPREPPKSEMTSIIVGSVSYTHLRTDNQRRRLLTINVPYQDLIDQKITKALLNFTSECDLISLNTTGGGESMQLVYEVDLNPQVNDFQLTNHLISNIENCDLALTKKAKKKKNL